MMSPMKRDEHVEESRSGDCLDRIHNLPDELLVHMLSFLPTRCAVSTSVLSTRWRYLFTMTNCLSLDDFPVSKGGILMLKKFVYNALHHISTIKKFSLGSNCTYDQSDLKTWVSIAVKKGVQDLHYQRVTHKDHELPDELFMCKTLVRLKIFSYQVEIPLSTWLPSLKILYLESVTFPDYDSLERLFSGCESLQELTLMFCRCYAECHFILSTGLLKVLTIENCSFQDGLFEIDAPNLAYLTYSFNAGVKIIPSWKYSCSLVEAKLTFSYIIAQYVSNKKSLQYDRELVKAAAYKTTELCLFYDSLELLAEHEEMPVFHNLSRLYPGRSFYDAWKYVTSLIDKSPQLETVMFESGLHNRRYKVPISPNEPLLPFSFEAKVIEVHKFCVDEVSLLRLGHLLRNARVLKKVILYKHHSLSMKKVQQIRNELLMLPRASKDCHIQLN